MAVLYSFCLISTRILTLFRRVNIIADNSVFLSVIYRNQVIKTSSKASPSTTPLPLYFEDDSSIITTVFLHPLRKRPDL
jgi:outer membrane lipoprotein-sorting protein